MKRRLESQSAPDPFEIEKDAKSHIPELRTFNVSRIGLPDTIVQAHSYSDTPHGSLVFELIEYSPKALTLVRHYVHSIAAGTWSDCREITHEMTARPVGN